MRFTAVMVLLFIANSLMAQISFRPTSIAVSYVGEMITHPGGKITLEYQYKRWNDVKKNKRGLAKTKFKARNFNLGVGSFYHKDYQIAAYIIPEFDFFRANRKGKFWSYGAGLGYMRTIIQNTYSVNDNGVVEETLAGHNYAVASMYISFGKDFYIAKERPFRYFIKPQFMIAYPNYPNLVGYFLLEAGVSFKLSDRW